MDDQSHDPNTLYRASLDRIETAWVLRKTSPVVSCYLAGLSIECILQAIALRHGAAHDARHDLARWLGKCPPHIQDALKSPPTSSQWSRVVAEWRNEHRYVDQTSFLGHARSFPRWRAMSGDDEARMNQFVKGFVEYADAIHKIGVQSWLRAGR